jgi:formate C-acetyltransferase
MLRAQGVTDADLPDYSIAGCQEPLGMGKTSINTTNTWLNLGKIVEFAANDGCSLLSGERLAPSWSAFGFKNADDAYARLEEAFFAYLDHFLPEMARAGNACTTLLGTRKATPFTSAIMDPSTNRDLRDPKNPGARYTGSGCLIHGLSVVADSLEAVGRALATKTFDAAAMRAALAANWRGAEAPRRFLRSQPKFGNHDAEVDAIAARIAGKVSDRVAALRNDAGAAYLADWSTPSTHLLYGYWVGATPDGRGAREMLGYGVDPRAGQAQRGLARRLQSAWTLPYRKMTGGYASHLGLRPDEAPAGLDFAGKGRWMRDRVVTPLFRLGEKDADAPFYVYFNIEDAGRLRAVLADPKRHAPDGVYIMRIHGTFVNFLDLSPAIQEDIMLRLDPASTASA